MLRANLIGPEHIELENIKRLIPKKGEVLIEVRAAGICGSDVHAYHGNHPFIKFPMVLGHEFSGKVIELGEGSAGVKKGDRVALFPSVTCGHCYNCKNKKSHICANLRVIGCVGFDGGFAEYTTVPVNNIIPISDSMSYKEAALIEPLSVAVHTVKRSGLTQGDRVVIFGSGPIGLFVLAVAKTYGAGEIIMTDLYDNRLKMAKEFGADHIVNTSRHDLIRYIQERFNPDYIDLIFDCVCNKETMNQAIEIARKGTKIMIVGLPSAEVSTKLHLVQDHELELIGNLMYSKDDFLEARNLIETKKIQIIPLITHSFKLKEIAHAFEVADKNKAETLKVIIEGIE
ncbi:MAG: alcohol dehydrogenase catalytic domain-containing protein [Actinobacteria bacterium]|nr:alcohol dehydrogenase catalytic domain-containing protein [Actinomycetota bacterium]